MRCFLFLLMRETSGAASSSSLSVIFLILLGLSPGKLYNVLVLFHNSVRFISKHPTVTKNAPIVSDMPIEFPKK